jgi:hypothetical protein
MHASQRPDRRRFLLGTVACLTTVFGCAGAYVLPAGFTPHSAAAPPVGVLLLTDDVSPHLGPSQLPEAETDSVLAAIRTGLQEGLAAGGYEPTFLESEITPTERSSFADVDWLSGSGTESLRGRAGQVCAAHGLSSVLLVRYYFTRQDQVFQQEVTLPPTRGSTYPRRATETVTMRDLLLGHGVLHFLASDGAPLNFVHMEVAPVSMRDVEWGESRGTAETGPTGAPQVGSRQSGTMRVLPPAEWGAEIAADILEKIPPYR